nr:hypothetical protein CKG001_23610 [Bdellovibrio sp. CKG001]
MAFEINKEFIKVLSQEIRLLKKRPDMLKRRGADSKARVFFWEKDMQTAFMRAIAKTGSFSSEDIKQQVDGKGYGLNLYLSERGSSRIDILVNSEYAVELKVISVPRLAKGSLYDIGQVSSDLYRYEYAKFSKVKKVTSLIMVTGPTIIGMRNNLAFSQNDIRRFVHNSFFADYCSSEEFFPSVDKKKNMGSARLKMRGVQKKYLEKLGFGEEYHHRTSKLNCYWYPQDSFAIGWVTREC